MVSRVSVQLGQEKRYTKVKDSSERPYYNEYFVFDFHGTLFELLELLLIITLFQPKHGLKKKKILGSARFDLATIWIQPDHHIFQKWIVLTDPDDPTGKIKGYLKCDIGIIAPEESFRTPLRPRLKKEIVERQYFIPEHQGGGKLSARYIVRIHSGMGLFTEHITLKEKKKLKKFVRVYFAGLSANTSPRSGATSTPVWNEEIVFTEKFPPLYNRLRIELHLSKHFYCSLYINLSDISDPTVRGFLPTFGPAHLNFYEPPYNYVGSILISIETKTALALHEKDKLLGVKRMKTPEILENMYWRLEEFVVYGIIYDISMLEKRSTNNRFLNCELSFGEDVTNSINKESSSFNSDLRVVSMDNQYNAVEISSSKKVLFVKKKLPDNRNRLFLSNKLHCIYRQFRRNLVNAHSKSEKSPSQADFLLHKAFSIFKKESTEFIKTSYPGPTILDKERIRMIQTILRDSIDTIDALHETMPFHCKFIKAIKIFKNLESVIEDPQDSFPYIIIVLRHLNKALSYIRIPARDVLFSPDPEEKGVHCGIIQHLFFNDANKKVSVKGKIDIFLWFSPYESFGYCMEHIPPGYIDFGHKTEIPSTVIYEEHSTWTCRAHIYQAQLEPCDEEGHCNTSVKIIIASRVAKTSIVEKSLSPFWSEVIAIDNLKLVLNEEYVKKLPPPIVVEVWSHGSKSFTNLIGTFVVTPYVYLTNAEVDKNYPPPLQWFTISSGKFKKGELLAMFELIEGSDDPNSNTYRIVQSIPDYIKPKFMKYRLEVLFWGVRTAKWIKLMSLNHPKAVINCGNITLSSEVMTSASSLPNFMQAPVFSDIDIPENISFAPPLTIRLYNNESFGTLEYIGSSVIHNIMIFLVKLTHKHKWLVAENERETTIKDSFLLGSTISSEESLTNIPLSKLKNLKRLQSIEVLERTLAKETKQNWWSRCRNFWLRCYRKRRKNDYLALPQIAESHLAKLPDPDTEEYYFDWWTKYYECLDRLTTEQRESQTGESSKQDSKTFFKIRKLTTSEYEMKNRISKIIIYTNELEAQPEYNGFTDCFRTFDFYKNKRDEIDKSNLLAKLKAAISLYKLVDGEVFVNHLGEVVNDEHPYFHHLASLSRESIPILIRVYAVRAHKLNSKDHQGTVDPYIELATPSTVISDRKNYLIQDSNPIFGKCFELDATLPFDSLVTIRIMDWDRGGNDLIGETVVDVESRYFSKHRGTCGISQIYNEDGYNKWRDVMKPTHLLEKLCHHYHLDLPQYEGNTVMVANSKFSGMLSKEDPRECAALTALKHWDTLDSIGCSLVKEHVETRSLYDPKYPGVEQGKLEMWIDIFPKIATHQIPPKVNIAPREPIDFELRVIVWSTSGVVLKDKSVFHGKLHTDIYIKSWLRGKEDLQKTDVHFNAIKGDGMFNWRFLYNFSFIREERLITFMKPNENVQVNKVPPIVYFQIWDNERFRPNEYLGSLAIDLNTMPLPMKEISRKMKSLFSEQTEKTIDLFAARHVRGWWPFMTNMPKYGKRIKVVGLVDLEFSLLTAEEAESSPAGRGRNEPEALSIPLRPSMKWSVWIVPLRAIWIYVCGYHKKKIIIFLIILAWMLFFLLFVYSIPKYTVKKILNA
ncbi:otoferlin-like isoform X3 [Rhodnius prolixus]